MSVIALLGLAVLWAIVLVPDLVRRGATLRRIDPIGQFAKNRSALHQSRPASRGAARPQAFGAPTSVDLRGASPVVTYDRQRAVSPNSPSARVAAPARKSRAEQRRQDVLTVLIAAALLSFLGFTAFGGPMLMVHVIADLLLVAYVALWLTVTKRERQRSTVSYLYPSPTLQSLAIGHDRHRVPR